MPWVAGHLTGGLGNRLFQHSAATALAAQWKREVVFYLPHCDATNHGPYDSIFKLFPSVPKISEGKSEFISEPPGHVFTYTPFPSSAPSDSNYSVDGWRQSSRYFPEGIRVDFENALGSSTKELLNSYKLETESHRRNTWFIHMRFGDYMVLPHHQIDIAAYYSDAVKHITPGARVIIFSDEATKYKTMIENFFKALGVEVEVIENEDELETLYLMSNCWGGAIIANSTFSWWGAYFARQGSGDSYKAVYPKVWGFGLPKANDINPSWSIVV